MYMADYCGKQINRPPHIILIKIGNKSKQWHFDVHIFLAHLKRTKVDTTCHLTTTSTSLTPNLCLIKGFRNLEGCGTASAVGLILIHIHTFGGDFAQNADANIFAHQ